VKNNEESNYRNVFKALSLFGSIQIFIIILGIVRTKVIALSVGPSGIGTIGLFTSSVMLISSITNLGIASSSIKQISESYFSEKPFAFEKCMFVLNKLAFYTAILGFFAVVFLSPFLSIWSFGSENSTLAFCVLALVIFLESYNTRNLAILQGIRKLKILGKVSIYGNILGSAISIPLYLLFKNDAIVPSLVILSFSNLLVSHLYTRSINNSKQKYSYSEIKPIINNLISLGIAMTISSILVYAVSYIIRIYITKQGGLNFVGLYQAGWVIINGYVGMIFSAMSKDYFPRLASVNSDNNQLIINANQQIELGLLILSPIILFFLIFADQIITLLYSTEFLEIKFMMLWSLLGMFFKLLSWSISYIFLAKGLSRYFIMYEIMGNIFTLVISIIGYKYCGLEGLGLAFLATNIFYLLLVFIFSYKIICFKFSSYVNKNMSLNFLICSLLTLWLRFSTPANHLFVNIVMGVAFIVVCCNSIIGLNQKMGIFDEIKSRLK
jgi:O-antigen/teichoic acid export membrane protein